MKKALEIKENLYWVGARDYEIEVFDIVMKTENGTTYNSYLLKGSEKTALIELCKEEFFDDFVEKINEVCDIKDIDFVITNHTEPDHSGSITKIVELNKDIMVYGSPVALSFLSEISRVTFNKQAVKEGDSLSLGNYTLEFISTPFLHWPDSQMTYCKELKTLFTCDVFGAHFASEEMFDDLITKDYSSDFKYYYDAIFSPFKEYVLSGIAKIENLEFDTILNGHGPILRKDIHKNIELYKKWSQPVKNDKPLVIIPYVSAYGYTKKMAEKIKEGVCTIDQIECIDFDVTFSDINEVKEMVEKANAVIFGSPTILADALPPIVEILNVINPVIHKGKIAGVFGSYGWSGEAVNNIASRLDDLRIEMPAGNLKVKFNPTDDDLSACVAYGKRIAESVMSSYNN